MMKWRWFFAVAVAASLCLFAGLGSPAQEKQPAKEEEKEDEQATKAAQAVQQIATANNLIEWGRQHKSPEALIAAVQILHHTPTQEFKDKIDVEGEKAEVKGPQTLKEELLGLLQEAKKMRPDDQHVAALADRTAKDLDEKPRGVLPAPFTFTRVLPAKGSFTFSRTWRPLTGRITMRKIFPPPPPFPSTPLRIEVRRAGLLIGQETGFNSITESFFVPKTAVHTITLRNLSAAPVRVHVAVN